ncbi:hypothetical protein X975_19913, partial [Stegodyphus mimosarum]
MTFGRFSPRFPGFRSGAPPARQKNEDARQTGRTHRSPLSTNMTLHKAFPAPSLIQPTWYLQTGPI